MANYRLSGYFKARSPISHISESISTVAYLSQEPILQNDGTVEEVFCYTGNAWRGQLRDLAATYMLEKLGDARLPLDGFHLLFSGGKLGSDAVTDVNRLRSFRKAIPMLALFGGGVGDMILPGKLRVSNAYPVCREAIPVLPEAIHSQAETISYSALTTEKSFSRRDDAKDDNMRRHISDNILLEDACKKKKGDGEVATQMRTTVELLIAGTLLYTTIDVLEADDVQLGALVSALHAFSRSPHIGGQANRGHGAVDLKYDLTDLDTGESVDFIKVSECRSLISPRAESAKSSYDAHLRTIYDAMLESKGNEILALLGAA